MLTSSTDCRLGVPTIITVNVDRYIMH